MDNMNHSKVVSREKNIGSLVLKLPQNLTLLFNQFHCLFDETNLQDNDDDKSNK